MAGKVLRNFKYLFRASSNTTEKVTPRNFSKYIRNIPYNALGKISIKTNVGILTIVFAGVAYKTSQYWTCNLVEKLKNFSLPVVRADYITPSNDEKSLRKRFNFIADVVEKTANAVVYIEVHDTRERRVDLLYGRRSSNGSGFIVKEDGLILTNAHVVTKHHNSSLIVKLRDGRTFKGVVEDMDITNDLATVRIKADNLPVMKLGSSASLRPGEWVVAIGSPLSLSNTITSGVVSAPHRQSSELGLRGRNMEYIQTDASITFGNSGGPLVNLDGEAVGINSLKVTPGISFAIPIDFAKEFLKNSEEKKRKSGKVSPPGVKKKYIGITMLTLTPELLQEVHVKNKSVPLNINGGVFVWQVMLGSPAHTSGIQTGDIVTHINTEPVNSVGNVYKALESGDLLKLKIIRGDQELQLDVIPEDIILRDFI